MKAGNRKKQDKRRKKIMYGVKSTLLTALFATLAVVVAMAAFVLMLFFTKLGAGDMLFYAVLVYIVTAAAFMGGYERLEVKRHGKKARRWF